MKDGAAAIYGARASNGVVIITTKGGGYNLEKPKIELSAYTGFSQVTSTPDLLNTQEHADVIFQSQLNDGITPSHPQYGSCLLYTSPSPRDQRGSRMPSSA